MTKEDLSNNELVKDAVIRNLEVIGEAVKKLPDNAKVIYGDIPCRKIAGLRDILIHEYFGININIVWDVIKNKIEDLKTTVLEMYETFRC